ncbi:MAG: sugar ABC transporter permease [Bacillota bacterium]|nr:sugar ABC transporter permease [Bacillota bacterium]
MEKENQLSPAVSKQANKRLTNYRKAEKFKDFLCVAPSLLFLFVLTYYPVFNSFYISLTDWNLLKSTKHFKGFDNYKWLFAGTGWDTFKDSIRVTFEYTFLEVLIAIVIGILLAALFNNMSKSFSIMRSIVFMPHYIAMSTGAVIFTWILNTDFGILNIFLEKLGFAKIEWLNSSKNALFAIVMLTGWKAVGYTMMIFLSGIRGIPVDYYEAASLDGAGLFKQFTSITLPLLSPTTLFIFVTTFIDSMKVFQSVEVMTNGGPLNATKVIVYWIYELGFVDYKTGRASAVVVLFFLFLLLFTALTMRVTNKNVHYEG